MLTAREALNITKQAHFRDDCSSFIEEIVEPTVMTAAESGESSCNVHLRQERWFDMLNPYQATMNERTKLLVLMLEKLGFTVGVSHFYEERQLVDIHLVMSISWGEVT